MSIKLPQRPARAGAVALAAIVVVALTAVTLQANAGATPRGDLDITPGPAEQMHEFGSSVTVKHTYFTRNDGPDDLPGLRIRVLSWDAGQINIVDPTSGAGTVCRAVDTCEMTISAAVPEGTGREFEVHLGNTPGAEYSVTVDPAPGSTDPNDEDNTATGTQPWPVTDLDLEFDSQELIWRNGNHVGVEYRFTVTNNGPQPLTELDIDVETQGATQIMITGPSEVPGRICRAVPDCESRFTGGVYEPGTSIPLEITVSGPARTSGQIEISPPWSTDPTPGPVFSFRLPTPGGKGV